MKFLIITLILAGIAAAVDGPIETKPDIPTPIPIEDPVCTNCNNTLTGCIDHGWKKGSERCIMICAKHVCHQDPVCKSCGDKEGYELFKECESTWKGWQWQAWQG